MPPRLPIRPLARQLTASISHAKAPISSTANKADLKHLGSARNASSDLFGLDDSTPRSTTPPTPSAPDAGPGARSGGGGSHLASMLERNNNRGFKSLEKTAIQESVRLDQEREELARYMTRRWKEGDAYTPHDLSISEMVKWKRPRQPSKDVLDLLGLNPLDHYKNFAMISEYMTDQGRIKPSQMTGLRPVNQRKIAKAIRRAIGMGIHPSTHRHPEILFDEIHSGPRYQSPAENRKEAPKKIKIK
ncbi:unnamed protein product [Discula destructiva]